MPTSLAMLGNCCGCASVTAGSKHCCKRSTESCRRSSGRLMRAFGWWRSGNAFDTAFWYWLPFFERMRDGSGSQRIHPGKGSCNHEIHETREIPGRGKRRIDLGRGISRIPKGFCNKAQGCEERAILGPARHDDPTPTPINDVGAGGWLRLSGRARPQPLWG